MMILTILFATCSHYLGSRGLVSGRRHDCHQFKCLRDKSLGRSKAMLNQKILKLRGSEMLFNTLSKEMLPKKKSILKKVKTL